MAGETTGRAKEGTVTSIFDHKIKTDAAAGGGGKEPSLDLLPHNSQDSNVRLNKMDNDTIAYIDKSVEVVRAQNDARFAEVLAKLSGIDRIPSAWQQFAALIGALAVTVGLVFTVLGLMGDRFSAGLSISEITLQSARNAEQIQTLAGQMAERDKQFGVIIEMLGDRVDPQ